jgi:hypothetical protein
MEIRHRIDILDLRPLTGSESRWKESKNKLLQDKRRRTRQTKTFGGFQKWKVM